MIQPHMSGDCLTGLAGEGSGEMSPVVNADLAEDGLDVVAHGVGR